MSNQNHAVQIVVRAKDGQVRAGFASQYPKREGWIDVATYGRWFGSQMSYRPFQRALEAARAEARRLNGESS